MEQPEITLDMRASALSNPNSWLYVIDPAFAPDEDVPPWGLVGAYPVDARGQIGDRFRPNLDYRPSPTALRMPPPANRLEKIIQLIHTRHRPQAALLPVLLDSTLLVYATTPTDRTIVGFPNSAGKIMIPACTSTTHIPQSWPAWREIQGHDLAPLLNGHPLALNPDGPITALIPAERLGSRSFAR
ncbi:type VII secretion system-associated protein [Actinokineospora iranica]|uniref:SseB protein N-terminal domain-containing protein n=1 Tax=Actinokineospora iranica TaxID=1271860 RepID=A0A1G6QA29_9PSEU|nr:type VII secretion system-associated protein [Actinokineospora iranica]SDC89071.1 SseB protein N-terminal domain-containing protein [Actinokineospora iranica]